MLIKEVSCEQFAGLKEKNIKFEKGINVIYGLNEAGKSTIIELIRKILFQNGKINKTKDKDFINNFFPHNVIGKDGDFVDGKLKIENEGIEYNFEKKWKEKNGECFSSIGKGSKVSEEDVFNENVIKAVEYDKGVFDEIIFSSQKFQQNTLNSIFGEIDKNKIDIKSELKAILSQAVVEIGGADIDEIGIMIDNKMKTLSSRFDVENGVPEKRKVKSEDRWEKEVGEILNNYYKLEDVKSEKEEVEGLEKSIDCENNKIISCEKEKEKLEKETEKIEKFEEDISKKIELEEKKQDKEDKIKFFEQIKTKWEAQIEKNKKEINKDLIEVSGEDVDTLRKQENIRDQNEIKLKALKLNAKIENYTDKNLEVTNINTNEFVSGIDGQYNIDGSTEIKIEGVVNIKLYPRGIDINTVKNELNEAIKTINELCKKYDVKNSEELRSKQKEYEKEVNKIIIEKESCKRLIEDYENNYISLENLKKNISKLKKEKDELEEELSNIKEIPEEYLQIVDIKSYIEKYNTKIENLKVEKEQAKENVITYTIELKGRSLDEIEEKVQDCQEKYDRSISEYKQYENIKNKFEEAKKMIQKNPMDDLEKSFKSYVEVITQDGVKIDNKDGKNIFDSNGNRLTAFTLSEGTKATIGLAFKLAVIENLFKENGLIILDDPFIDMDIERTNNACQLLKKFAEKNQVIITTCDENYVDLLKGCNKIEL